MQDDGAEPDLIQEGIRQARYREVVQNLRALIFTVEIACMATPILLALILWRVW